MDLEGLAVAGNRIFVGLRGPVLRGWAVILEFGVEDADPLGVHGRRLRLRRDDEGTDLVVLGGPTMMLDGPVRLLRLRDGAVVDESKVVRADDLTIMHELPYGTGKDAAKDHAEGFTRLPGAGDPTNPGGLRQSRRIPAVPR